MIMDDIESKKLIRSETKFIVPFSYNKEKYGIDFEKFIDSCSTPIGAWEFDNSANINHARYLLSHVNKDLKRCTNFHFQATSPDFYSRYHLYSEFDADEGSLYEFELLDVSLKFFSTGIGMIIFSIIYPETVDLKQIINISADLSRFYRNDEDREYIDSRNQTTKINKAKVKIQDINGTQISFARLLKTALQIEDNNNQSIGIKLFPETENKRTFVFQRVVGKAIDEDLFNLQDNLWSGLSNDGSLEKIKLGTGHFCLASTKTMCHITTTKVELAGDLLRQKNIDTSYFLMYLLLIHEQQVLFMYYEQVIDFMSKDINTDRSKKNFKNARILKKNLLECLTDYSFEVISEEKYYQNVYLKYRELLSLEALEGNIGDLVNAINDELTSRRDGFINALFGLITIFGIVSVLSDLGSVVGFFSTSAMAQKVSVVIGLILLAIIGLIIYLIRKLSEQND